MLIYKKDVVLKVGVALGIAAEIFLLAFFANKKLGANSPTAFSAVTPSRTIENSLKE